MIAPINHLLDLSEKTAIVTGGAMGIGFGIAYRLAEAGCNVIISDINLEEAEKSADKLKSAGWKVKAVKADVSNKEDVKNLVNETIKTFSGVDILVNNAGIYPSMPISKMQLEDFEKVLAINLNGVFLTTKYVSEVMIARNNGGKIINITSVDALHPSSIGLAHYDASKHGVWGFTKNSALELAPHKIWVNAIAPGGILTPGVENLQKNLPKDTDLSKMMETFLKKIPMQRFGSIDEIGKVTLFLASDMSSYMTGSQIIVDGGVLLS